VLYANLYFAALDNVDCASVQLRTTSLLSVEPFTNIHPSWHSCLAPIDVRSSQQTLQGRSKILSEGYGMNRKTQECVRIIYIEEVVLLTVCWQVDEELGRQMAQMKLIVQGTPGSPS